MIYRLGRPARQREGRRNDRQAEAQGERRQTGGPPHEEVDHYRELIGVRVVLLRRIRRALRLHEPGALAHLGSPQCPAGKEHGQKD